MKKNKQKLATLKHKKTSIQNKDVPAPAEAPKKQDSKKVHNKEQATKSGAFTPRTNLRNQHPRPEPEKKEPKEIKLPNTETKVPTGKVITLEEREARKKTREEAYRAFRINAFKRRCKRNNISQEETEELVKKLKKILDAPHEYLILVMFSKKDLDMAKQAALNAKLKWKMCSSEHMYFDGNKEVLDKLREIMPVSAKIYPYTKKTSVSSLIPCKQDKKSKPKTKAEKKTLAFVAKTERKMKNVSKIHHHSNRKKTITLKTLRAANKRVAKKVAVQVHKKPSNSIKKSRKAIKQAA